MVEKEVEKDDGRLGDKIRGREQGVYVGLESRQKEATGGQCGRVLLYLRPLRGQQAGGKARQAVMFFSEEGMWRMVGLGVGSQSSCAAPDGNVTGRCEAPTRHITTHKARTLPTARAVESSSGAASQA
jgi:hypothetical protein